MTVTIHNSAQTYLVSTFHIGNALCGLDTADIQEVIQVGEVTPVHHAAEYIVGIINLRGKIVTVIDLGRKLDLGKSQITEYSRILIVESGEEFCGLLADSVSDVVSADKNELVPPPANVNGVQSKYFEGVYHHKDKLIALLNLEMVLAAEAE